MREKLAQKVNLKTKYPVQYYEIERFKVISQWHHFAILNLTFIRGFKSNTPWIAKRLGITTVEAQEAITRLIELGLLERSKGVLKSSSKMLFVDQKSSELSMRQFHLQRCDQAKHALTDPSPEAFPNQFFSGLTLAIDRKRMPEFKKKLKEISEEVMAFAMSDSYSDVYHLNLHFFPVTKNEKDKTRGPL